MKQKTLYLSPAQYSEMLEARQHFSHFNADWTVDYSEFRLWAMFRYGLKPFTDYTIVVETKGGGIKDGKGNSDDSSRHGNTAD